MKLNSRSIGTLFGFLIPFIFLWAIQCFFIDENQNFNDLETPFKVIALYTAFWFFVYKLITGRLNINLTVDLETERIAYENGMDYLCVHILLSKGRTDSVWLKDIVINVKTCSGTPDETAIHASDATQVLIRPVGIKRTLQLRRCDRKYYTRQKEEG